MPPMPAIQLSRTKVTVLVMAILVGNFGCDTIENRGINTKAVADEIRNREVKHITQAQIMATAYQWGGLLSDTLSKALVAQMRAVEKYPVLEAAQYCNLQRLKPTPGLAKKYQADFRRIRLKGTSNGTALDPLETQLLDAYRYNTEQKLPLSNNVQRANTRLLFTDPILVTDQVCLRCHGKVGETLNADDYGQLKKMHVMDGLVGYSMGQPLAILRVRFDQKELIKNIEAD